jgi:hypothetical protein
LFRVKHNMTKKKNNTRTSKIISLGMPRHPILLSSNVRFPISNSCFNFSTMIVVYILETMSFFVSLFLWFLIVFFIKLKTQKKILLYLVSFLSSSLPFLEKQKLQKHLLSSLLFPVSCYILSWFFLVYFCLFSFQKFCYLLSLALSILFLDF